MNSLNRVVLLGNTGAGMTTFFNKMNGKNSSLVMEDTPGITEDPELNLSLVEKSKKLFNILSLTEIMAVFIFVKYEERFEKIKTNYTKLQEVVAELKNNLVLVITHLDYAQNPDDEKKDIISIFEDDDFQPQIIFYSEKSDSEQILNEMHEIIFHMTPIKFEVERSTFFSRLGFYIPVLKAILIGKENSEKNELFEKMRKTDNLFELTNTPDINDKMADADIDSLYDALTSTSTNAIFMVLKLEDIVNFEKNYKDSKQIIHELEDIIVVILTHFDKSNSSFENKENIIAFLNKDSQKISKKVIFFASECELYNGMLASVLEKKPPMFLKVDKNDFIGRLPQPEPERPSCLIRLWNIFEAPFSKLSQLAGTFNMRVITISIGCHFSKNILHALSVIINCKKFKKCSILLSCLAVLYACFFIYSNSYLLVKAIFIDI